MNEDQKVALETLKSIECNLDPDGCDGKWCSARDKVLKAFPQSEPLTTEEIKSLEDVVADLKKEG